MAIIVVIKTPEHAIDLFNWAWRLAQSRKEGLTVLAIEECEEESTTPVDLRQALAKDVAPILKTLRAEAEAHPEPFDDDPETPPLFVRHIRTQKGGHRVIEEANRVDASLVIVRGRRSNEEVDRSLSQYLYVHCHRALMVVTGSAQQLPRRILVPTTEGCHTQEALKTAHSIVTESNGEVTALYIQLATDDGDHGSQILEDALRRANLLDVEHVVRRVDTAPSLDEGIRAAKTDHDAIFCGAPRRGDPKKSLLDLVPDELLDDTSGRLVAVMRAQRTPIERFMEAFDRMVHLWVPQMKRQRRKEIYEQLEEQSEWSFDFKMLMALSTCIASFGLIQNSAAVVIGAMLVAPLMTPMLCAGMAIQQGNRQLLTNNAKAILGGFTTAVIVAFVVGLLSPFQGPTEEMMGRGLPTPLDLGVALVSGFAAAYAFSRGEKLAAMLPGVAIAAALVPPIATTGLCFSLVASTGLWKLFSSAPGTVAGDAALMGLGAALLFLTNVVAIVLGASIAFYSFGIRRWDPEPWVKRVTHGLVIAVFVLAIPLSAILWDTMQRQSRGLTVQIEEVLKPHKPYRLKYIQRVDNRLEVYLSGPRVPDDTLMTQLRTRAERKYGKSVVMHVMTEMTTESRPDAVVAEDLGTISSQIGSAVAQYPNHELVEIDKKGRTIEVTLRGDRAPPKRLLNAIQKLIEERYGRGYKLTAKLEWSFQVSPQKTEP